MKAYVDSKEEKLKVIRDILKHGIFNKLILSHVSLLNQVHEPYNITPQEILHVSDSGLIICIFETPKVMTLPGDQRKFDAFHQQVTRDIT